MVASARRTKSSEVLPAAAEPAASKPDPAAAAPETAAPETIDSEAIDGVFKDLKSLLSTVEKLQKARQEVGDIKPLLLRLLDGELLDGEELEQLKAGVGGLGKLVRLYSDYQGSLERAQGARALLDQALH